MRREPQTYNTKTSARNPNKHSRKYGNSGNSSGLGVEAVGRLVG